MASAHRFFTSALILASSVAVNSFSAKATGHMAPSSRFALILGTLGPVCSSQILSTKAVIILWIDDRDGRPELRRRSKAWPLAILCAAVRWQVPDRGDYGSNETSKRLPRDIFATVALTARCQQSRHQTKNEGAAPPRLTPRRREHAWSDRS